MKMKFSALPIYALASTVLFHSVAVAAEPGVSPLTLKVSPTDKDVRLSYEATGLEKLRGILIRISNSAGKEVHNQEYRCTAEPCAGELEPLALPLGAYIVDAFAMGADNTSLTDVYETFAIAIENLQPQGNTYQPPVQAVAPPSYQQLEYRPYDTAHDTAPESSSNASSSTSSSDTFLPPLSFSSGAAVSSFGSSSSDSSSTSSFSSGNPSTGSSGSTVTGTAATGINNTLPANFVPPAFMGKLPLPVVTTK